MSLDNGLRFISTTIGEVGAVGMACLLALHIADRNMAEDELLAIVHLESIATLRKHLNFCAMHDYASMVKRSARQSALWHITDIGKSIILRVISLLGLPGVSTRGPVSPTAQPRLIAPADAAVEEKKFFSAPSSSSDPDLDQSNSDSDLTEEEDGVEFKNFLCREYGLTGDRARQIVADPRIWSDDIVAWMWQVKQLARNGMKFRKSPEAYAIGCLLKPDGPDEPSKEAQHIAHVIVAEYWKQFQYMKRLRDEPEEEDNHE